MLNDVERAKTLENRVFPLIEELKSLGSIDIDKEEDTFEKPKKSKKHKKTKKKFKKLR